MEILYTGGPENNVQSLWCFYVIFEYTNAVCSNLYYSLFLFSLDLLTLLMLIFYLAHGFISCIITFFKKKVTYIFG